MLGTWSDRLLSLQTEDGSFACPACGFPHGRCFDAMYPFLYLYRSTENDKWLKGALCLFAWAERNVSQKNGSYLNDIHSTWTGTTVFSLIQLLDSLTDFGDVLGEANRDRIADRVRKAAEYLYTFDDLKTRNINYPVADSLALYLAYQYYGDSRYLAKSNEYVAVWKQCFTSDFLLFGEGTPREKQTAKRNVPVDIGYNLEESLPSLIRLGLMSDNKELVDLGLQSLKAHLYFLLSDGGIDNSFGTRSFKWTYYGSRTSDGMSAAFLMLKEKNPEFVWAAVRNLRLQKECMVDGLLAGGPMYGAAGQKPCIHHAFTHAKVLAFILQKHLYEGTETRTTELPRYRLEGIKSFPELSTCIISHGLYTATVTASDWVYLPEGHPGGGSVSLLHHMDAGLLLASSMNEYILKERFNMQEPCDVGHHECLTTRIEQEKDGVSYASLYDFSASLEEGSGVVHASGILKDKHGEKLCPYAFSYTFDGDGFLVTAWYKEGRLIMPVVVEAEDEIAPLDGKLVIRRRNWVITVSTKQYELPYGLERVFSLVPGFQAVKISCAPIQGKTMIHIKVEKK